MHDIMVYSQTSKCEIFLQAVTLIPSQDHKQNPEEVFVIMHVGRQFQLTAAWTKGAKIKILSYEQQANIIYMNVTVPHPTSLPKSLSLWVTEYALYANSEWISTSLVRWRKARRFNSP
jgi:hypothetical protein